MKSYYYERCRSDAEKDGYLLEIRIKAESKEKADEVLRKHITNRGDFRFIEVLE